MVLHNQMDESGATNNVGDHSDGGADILSSDEDESDDPYFGMTPTEAEEARAKHERFESLRKQHYNMKAVMMKHREFDESEEESGADEDK
jgi:hypothetical protein